MMSLISLISFIIILVFVSIEQVRAAQPLSYPLPKFNIQPQTLSISGLSSGAYMAVQFSVAFSSSNRGVGVFAGGPYYCARGDFATANAACMKVASMIDLATLQKDILSFQSNGFIDPIANIAQKHRVYLFSGTKDYIVFPEVMKKLKDQYVKQLGLDEKKIVSDFDVPASHAMITNNYGAKCDAFGSPFINNCNLDGASKALETILTSQNYTSTVVTPDINNNFHLFSQSNAYSATSFDDYGYIYIPTGCKNGDACRVHVAFHGCLQGRSFVNDVFAQHAGYLEHAEANNIIFIFPQVKGISGNNNGCWNWFGYGSDHDLYATKQGEQMKAVRNMLADLGVDI
ncbi:hypothetical protein C9374_013563 [Naegleria lovaniensis]|uniref:Poly (3-hydroxybutyrate) depolymerase n=1 Tax=Naegleria lovaniensis TaxID=51637 RepID=A0AA88KNG6_NAELO|nr:uncharacterized protein C9374_013563 [Naegleria lovaniensis]KAG2392078.1 hypothetical protein C9374_013563 [Naegleria lovaniensis]